MGVSTDVLFVTWDGPQSSYLDGLFLPIFRMLAERGFIFHIVQFTWGDKQHRLTLKKLCEDQGFSYREVAVLRRPVAVGSLATAVWGARHVRKAIHDFGIDIVMPRSTLPALASILALRHLPSVGFLFDADGLPHDERVDFGGWSPNGLAYRLLRDLEACAIRRADAVLTRSKKAIDILVARGGAGVDFDKFYVVGNGRNEKLFRPTLSAERIDVRRSLGIKNTAPLVVFVGSSTEGKYSGREMLEFFRLVRNRREDARLLLLIGSPNEADAIFSEHEYLRSSCIVQRVPADEVPRYLSACDLGLAFIRPSFSMQAAAAIKLGEYLLCGIPVLTTCGIGDTDELVTDRVGYVMKTMSLEELETAADWFVHTVIPNAEGFREPCREVGLRNFSLTASVNVYAHALETIERS